MRYAALPFVSTAKAEVTTDHASSNRRNLWPSADDSSAEWLTYLRKVCGLLWPPPAEIAIKGSRLGWPGPLGTSARGAAGLSQSSEFVLVPGVGRPPLLVPAKRDVAAAAVRHYSGPRSPATRLTARMLALGLASGLGGAMIQGRMRVGAPLGTDNIETFLREAVSPGIQVSMYLGPARANRKPVLQLLTPVGQPIGFAKIGVSPLTRDLVRAEHAALGRLSQAGLVEVTVPPVLHFGEWHGLDVLVLGALPVWQRHHPVSGPQLAAAMGEVARVDGLTREPLRGSAYLERLRGRLAGADEGQDRAALQGVLATLGGRLGDVVLTYGAWHGDWAPWNMAHTGCGLLVWDWERFDAGVPLGFDALHHWLQGEVGPRHHDPLASATGCSARAAELLTPFGIAAPEARLTALLYLADLATRYLVDRQAEAGAQRGAPGTWLIPALITEVARL